MPPALRRAVVLAIPIVAFAGLMLAGPIHQNPALYDYADRRAFFAIANFNDVVSNLAFLAAGVAGLFLLGRRKVPGARTAWIVFFAGIVLVTFGSAQYHLDPRAETLVWDRLPMTVAFTAAYAALLSEYLDSRLERGMLLPALLAGVVSVVIWAWTDNLAPYLALQATVFATGLWLPAAFPGPRREKWMLFGAFGAYALAVVSERLDYQIFAATGQIISGHTLKHLLAALAPWLIYRMLAGRARESVGG